MARFLSLDEIFEGHHFDGEIIVLCVRWYLRFKLSFRPLVEMMAERGLSMAHTTIMRWVHPYAPVRAPLEPVRTHIGRVCGIAPSRARDEGLPVNWPPTRSYAHRKKYLNNLIEQDHRGVKLRIGPMLGFKRFRTAAATIAGIELLHRIHKGQLNLGKLR